MKFRLLALALLLVCFTPLAHAADNDQPLPMLINPVLPVPPSNQTPGFANIGSTAANVLTFVDSTNCKPSTSCSYEVTAFNTAGESQPSNIVNVTWSATNTKTTLTWLAPTSGGTPTGYNVYFLAAPGAPSSLSGTVN